MASRGYSSFGARASHWGGFSCCGARALGAQASVVVVRGHSSCGLRALVHWLWRTGLVARWHVESSWTRAWTRVPCIGRQILNHCTSREAQDTSNFKCVIHSSPTSFYYLENLRLYLLKERNNSKCHSDCWKWWGIFFSYEKKNIQPCSLEAFLFPLTRPCVSIFHGFKARLHSLNENTMSSRLLKSIKCQGFSICMQLPLDKNAFQKTFIPFGIFFP